MNSARIIFVNRFYWPEEPATAQLLTDLAEALAQAGHAVTIVTRQPERPDCPPRECHAGVNLERVRTTRWGRRSLLGRAVDFATFHLAAFFCLLRLARPGDTVVALTDPPLIGIIAAWAARWRGARLVHWVQDIYPEVAAVVGGPRWLQILNPLRNAAWRQAVACVVPGQDMATIITAAGVAASRVIVSPNWAPAGLVPPDESAVTALRRAWGLEGKFVAAYSGNLGRVHDLDPLLAMADQLRDDPTFALVFIGDGAQRRSIEKRARDRALANVHFFPAQPRGTLAVSLGVGHVHFVTLRPGAERCVFPSKLYGIARIGRPVVLVSARDCELARLVRQHGIGATFVRDEAPAIAAYLRALRSDSARQAQLSAAASRFAGAGFSQALAVWSPLMRAELALQRAAS